MRVRATLSIVLSLASLGLGLWTASVAASNHGTARELDDAERRREALEIAIDRLEWRVLEKEEELLRSLDASPEPSEPNKVGEVSQ